jgi:hypothetical protein
MQMRHGFAGMRPVVENQPEPGFGDPELARDFSSLEQQMAENLVILRFGLRDADDRLLWDNQHMLGRLGIDVAKSQDQIVFINDRGRDFTGDDFLEKSFAHGGSKLRRSGQKINRFTQHLGRADYQRQRQGHQQVLSYCGPGC